MKDIFTLCTTPGNGQPCQNILVKVGAAHLRKVLADVPHSHLRVISYCDKEEASIVQTAPDWLQEHPAGPGNKFTLIELWSNDHSCPVILDRVPVASVLAYLTDEPSDCYSVLCYDAEDKAIYLQPAVQWVREHS